MHCSGRGVKCEAPPSPELLIRIDSEDNTAVFIRHQSNVVELGKLIDVYCSERCRNKRYPACRMSSLNRCTQVVEYINDLSFLALDNPKALEFFWWGPCHHAII